MNFTAIIPARSGSRRLKNKNILPFCGKNLLTYKINQLKKVKYINNIVVSSDSDEYLEIAKKENVNIHKRSIEYSDEKSKTFGEVVEKICSDIDGDNILWCTCTSPFVSPNLYNKAISLCIQNVPLNNDSVVSFEEIKRYIWKNNKPFNYKLGIQHVPSQQLESLYYVTDGILIAPRLKMIQWKYFHGQNPYKFIIDKISSIDIDTKEDYIIAKSIAEKYGELI